MQPSPAPLVPARFRTRPDAFMMLPDLRPGGAVSTGWRSERRKVLVPDSPAPDMKEIESLAARLRMLYADSAHQSADERRQDLLAEIEHALGNGGDDGRAAMTRALLESLPGWEASLAVGAPSDGASPTSRDAELRDPAFLVERLEEIAGALTDAQRDAIAARLAGVGIGAAAPNNASTTSHANASSASSGTLPADAVARLSALLRAEGTAAPDTERLLELACAMTDLVTKLDQLAWSTWRAMSPRSEFKRRTSTQEAMRRYLAGDPAVSREHVAEEIDRLRRLAGALISTVAKVGFVAYRQVAKNAPHEIEVLAKPEKKAFESLEVACWKKYRQLAGNLDQALVEAEMLSAMSDSVEALVRGISRTSQ